MRIALRRSIFVYRRNHILQMYHPQDGEIMNPTRPVRLLPAALMAAALLVSCGDESTDFDFTAFEGGTFQFTNIGVDDGCYDGSFNVIFMPEGTANDWDITTEIPGWGDLPSTYDLSLPDPFTSMEVTVDEAGDGVMAINDVPQPGQVELDPDNFPGCFVDVVISADLTIIDADNLQGSATLVTQGFDDDPTNCPVVEEDPCTISLDLTATRVQ